MQNPYLDIHETKPNRYAFTVVALRASTSIEIRILPNFLSVLSATYRRGFSFFATTDCICMKTEDSRPEI